MQRKFSKLMTALLFGLASTGVCLAQTSPPALAVSNADNAWMLVSSALVLLMTGPGLALFYGGLVRRKNVLSVMMQSFAMMALITLLWAIVSYSLAFDAGTSFIGGLHHAFMRDVALTPDADYGSTIPVQTFMLSIQPLI